jgi:hypothetical protein
MWGYPWRWRFKVLSLIVDHQILISNCKLFAFASFTTACIYNSMIWMDSIEAVIGTLTSWLSMCWVRSFLHHFFQSINVEVWTQLGSQALVFGPFFSLPNSSWSSKMILSTKGNFENYKWVSNINNFHLLHMIPQNCILSYNNCNEITQTQDETSFITNGGVNHILHVHSNRVPIQHK